MSLYVLRLPFLQRSPRVWRDSSSLYARTSRWYQFLNLGSYCRTVQVAKTARQIIINVRRLWFLRTSTVVPFERIAYVERRHWDVVKSVGLTAEGFSALDATEVWYVRVILRDSADPINLFRFIGDGSRLMEWFGVVFGGYSIVDLEGMQEPKSEAYAKLVAEFTGVGYEG
jgi:hypothetical protein